MEKEIDENVMNSYTGTFPGTFPPFTTQAPFMSHLGIRA